MEDLLTTSTTRPKKAVTIFLQPRRKCITTQSQTD